MKASTLIIADRHLGVLQGTSGLVRDMFDAVVMVADERSLLEVSMGMDPDLVIADLSLSEQQSVCIAERLLEHQPNLRIVVVGVYEDASVAERIMAAGASGYIVKRVVGSDVLPAIRRVIAGGTYVSPSVQAVRDLRIEEEVDFLPRRLSDES
ncbi:MAG: response regulator [Pirellula sp.]|nr:response regulator [Pirellula sp.]